MQTLAEMPYFELQFNTSGDVCEKAEVAALLTLLDQRAVTDLFVMAHGWNNDMEEARQLYTGFFNRVRAVLNTGRVSGLEARQFAILGVLWPSKKFADPDLIASGAAAASSPITNALIYEQIDTLKALLDDPGLDAKLDDAKELVPSLEDKKASRHGFLDLMRRALQSLEKEDEDDLKAFLLLSNEDLLERLSVPVLPTGVRSSAVGGAVGVITRPHPQSGGAVEIPSTGTIPSSIQVNGSSPASMESGSVGTTADRHPPTGGATGLWQSNSARTAIRNLLNLTTYYRMKERAGRVGQGGVNSVLHQIHAQFPFVKLHLIGHSFGGRLVTAALTGSASPNPLRIDTLTLLQAAFSHYGFAEHYEGVKNGYFRGVVADHRVSGPTLITHTANDRTIEFAYSLASLIAHQVGTSLHDQLERYGGLGCNGALKTPEAIRGRLESVGHDYRLQKGKLYNLQADAIIRHHSDICKDEIAYAVLAAVAAQ